MAISYVQDLLYSSSNLLSIYNPQVLIVRADLNDEANAVTASVVLTYGSTTLGLEPVETERDDVSGFIEYRLELDRFFQGIMSKLNKITELATSDWGIYGLSDNKAMSMEVNIAISIQETGYSAQTDDYDVVICRSVNPWGETSGANLYNIWDLDARPTYHVWSNLYCQFGVYLRNTSPTTKATFSRGLSDITVNAAQSIPGMFPLWIKPDMTDEKENIIDGNPFAYDTDGSGFYPANWTPYGTRDVDNYFDFVSGNMVRIYSSGMLSHIGFYQDILKTGKRYKIEVIVYSVTSGGIRVKTETLQLNTTITSPGTYSYEIIPTSDQKFYIEDVTGTTDVIVQSVSVLESYFDSLKQTIEMAIDDDSGLRYADIIVHAGCDSGINVRYLSRDYGLRQWQFNMYNTKGGSVNEGQRILNNIDDMTNHTSIDYVSNYESIPFIDCVYKSANIEEQLLLSEIYSSPFVELLVNDTWIRVFPSGSHEIDSKRSAKDFNIRFTFSKEFTQIL